MNKRARCAWTVFVYEIVVFFVLWTQPGMDEMKRTSENLVCEQFYYLGRRDSVGHGVGSIPSDSKSSFYKITSTITKASLKQTTATYNGCVYSSSVNKYNRLYPHTHVTLWGYDDSVMRNTEIASAKIVSKLSGLKKINIESCLDNRVKLKFNAIVTDKPHTFLSIWSHDKNQCHHHHRPMCRK